MRAAYRKQQNADGYVSACRHTGSGFNQPLSMFSLGLNEKTDRQLDTMQHVIYGNLTKEQCDRLRADERVDDSLMMKTGLASEMDGYTIQLSYTEQKKSSIAAADIKKENTRRRCKGCGGQSLYEEAGTSAAIGKEADFPLL